MFTLPFFFARKTAFPITHFVISKEIKLETWISSSAWIIEILHLSDSYIRILHVSMKMIQEIMSTIFKHAIPYNLSICRNTNVSRKSSVWESYENMQFLIHFETADCYSKRYWFFRETFCDLFVYLTNFFFSWCTDGISRQSGIVWSEVVDNILKIYRCRRENYKLIFLINQSSQLFA